MDTIGLKVKELRLSRGMTLKELSEQTGLSTGFLSQFERGITTIAVEHLYNLSKVLGVTIHYFFKEQPRELKADPVIRSYGQEVLRVFNQSIYKSLSAKPEGKAMMPKLIEILPSASYEKVTEYSHHGEEFIYVLEGILTLHHADKEYQLYTGDSAHYESTIPHNWANHTNQVVKLICVHTPSDLYEEEACIHS